MKNKSPFSRERITFPGKHNLPTLMTAFLLVTASGCSKDRSSFPQTASSRSVESGETSVRTSTHSSATAVSPSLRESGESSNQGRVTPALQAPSLDTPVEFPVDWSRNSFPSSHMNTVIGNTRITLVLKNPFRKRLRTSSTQSPQEFLVQYSSDSGGSWQNRRFSNSATGTAYCEVDGLANGTNYKFRVAGLYRTAEGFVRGPFGNVGGVFAPTGSVPKAPTNLVVTELGRHPNIVEAALSWAPPEGLDESSLIEYEVSYFVSGSGEYRERFRGSATQVTVSRNLERHRSTQFKVAVVTNLGQGEFSSPVTHGFSSPFVPDMPADSRVYTRGDSEITLLVRLDTHPSERRYIPEVTDFVVQLAKIIPGSFEPRRYAGYWVPTFKGTLFEGYQAVWEGGQLRQPIAESQFITTSNREITPITRGGGVCYVPHVQRVFGYN